MKLKSGREGRIIAEYRGLKKRWDYRNSGLPHLYRYLAEKWGMPIRELKELVRSPEYMESLKKGFYNRDGKS